MWTLYWKYQLAYLIKGSVRFWYVMIRCHSNLTISLSLLACTVKHYNHPPLYQSTLYRCTVVAGFIQIIFITIHHTASLVHKYKNFLSAVTQKNNKMFVYWGIGMHTSTNYTQLYKYQSFYLNSSVHLPQNRSFHRRLQRGPKTSSS